MFKNVHDAEKSALERNINWFLNSGIMDPANGTWGVAERITLTKNNSAIDKTKEFFSAYTDYDGYAVLEHRRPDCNFETALMFLLTGDIFNDQNYYDIADNIIHYLHCRSCTRNWRDENQIRHLWRWAAGYWWVSYYIDDNSWNGALSIMIGKQYPKLNKTYSLIENGVETVEAVRKSIQNLLDDKEQPKDEPQVAGVNLSPHFAALALMAFANSWKVSENPDLHATALQYIDRVQEMKKDFTSSEHGYYLIGNACCASAFGDEIFLTEAKESADCILSVMSPEGVIPSEHNEAPIGKNLVDTVYTQNWCTLGLHAIWKLTGDISYRDAYERSAKLLAKIQDQSPAPHLNGCWRGMYDMEHDTWGGGDLFEGGENSIYSGWTNAPISFTFAMDILNISLLPG